MKHAHAHRLATIAFVVCALATTTGAGAERPLALPAAARDSWIELRTPSFVTLTNAGERKGREIAIGFERFRAALGLIRPGQVEEPPVPTTILVFDDDRGFDPYKIGVGDSRKLLMGLFQHSSLANQILLNGHPERGSALPVVYHEYEHAVMHASFSSLPLWLDEGLAEFHSTFAFERGDVLVGKPVAAHIHVMRDRSFMPLERLFAVDHSSPEYQESERVGIFYAESWLLVHYLLLGGPERTQKTMAFLSGVQQGTAPEPAFRGAFGYGFDQLEKELRRYVNAPTFPYLKLAQAQLGPEPPVTVRPLSRGEVLLELGTALAMRGDGGDEGLARLHLEAAAAEGVADAWAILALLEESKGGDAAAGLYRKALAAGAAGPVALLAAARSQLSAPGADAATALAAREQLRRALASAPDYAEARAALGRTWLLTEEDPGEGIAELTKAYHRLPGRADIAYNLAMLQLRAGQLARAEQLLQTVIVPLGSAEMAAQARAAIERAKAKATVDEPLASGDAGRAAAALEAALRETTDPALRTELEVHLREARAFQAREQQVERYNAAVAHANAGKRTQALAELRELRGEVDDAKLIEAIDAAMAKLR
jgi:hypothetical protein